jgi:hypothetical protein
VVSLPQAEHTTRVSLRPYFNSPSVFALQVLHRFGSLLSCLSRKNSCSSAEKTKSPPQTKHLIVRSVSSIVKPLLGRICSHQVTAKRTELEPTSCNLELVLGSEVTMVCKVCRASALQRVRRRGFLGWLLRWFGLYPWQCLVCDKTRFYRQRRVADRRSRTVERTAPDGRS